jgi:hypothetical protein
MVQSWNIIKANYFLAKVNSKLVCKWLLVMLNMMTKTVMLLLFYANAFVLFLNLFIIFKF